MAEVSTEEAQRRQALIDDLVAIGIDDGVFHVMVREGQLLELKCETERCYCDQGRFFSRSHPCPIRTGIRPWTTTRS